MLHLIDSICVRTFLKCPGQSVIRGEPRQWYATKYRNGENRTHLARTIAKTNVRSHRFWFCRQSVRAGRLRWNVYFGSPGAVLHGSSVNCQNASEVNANSLLTGPKWNVSFIWFNRIISRRYHNGPRSLSEAVQDSMASDPLAPILWEPHLHALNRRLCVVLEALRDCIEHNPANGVIYPKWTHTKTERPPLSVRICTRVRQHFTKSMSMASCSNKRAHQYQQQPKYSGNQIQSIHCVLFMTGCW